MRGSSGRSAPVAARVALVLAAAAALAGSPRAAPAIVAARPDVMPHVPAGATRPLDWWGGTYRTGDGESVRVYVSDFYPPEEAHALRWVEFLGGLVHGRELSDLTLYVAPEGVVSRMCGPSVLGCYAYDDESIVVIGDEVELPEPLTVEQVLAHEYGHHVANNRENTPWRAVMWGTKRWASLVGVCARVRAGTAGDRYDRDPGEGFAETYRVLVDRARGVPFVWPIVDESFAPTAMRLAAVRLDVLVPWTPTRETLRGRLAAPGRSRRYSVATPRDGTLRAHLALPRGARAQVTIAPPVSDEAPAGRPGWKVTICGERRAHVVVRTISGGGTFRLTVTKP